MMKSLIVPKRNDIVKSLFKSLLITLIINSCGIALCNFFDGLFVSKYLGSDAMAAYSVATTMFGLMAIFSGILSGGLSIVLAKELASGHTEKANKLFNAALIVCLGIGVITLLIGLFMPQFLAAAFGAKDLSSTLNKDASDFIRGISISFPFLMMYSSLLPLFSLDGGKAIVKISSLTYAGVNILFDILNGEFFHLGMFGMGLATTIGYVTAFIPILFYLLKKKHVLHLSLKNVSFKSFGHVLRMGLPQVTKRLSTTLASLIANFIFISIGSTIALTAFGIEKNVFSIVNIFVAPIPSLFTTLFVVFYLDRDEISCSHLIKAILCYLTILCGGLVILIEIFAPYIVNLYCIENLETYNEAVLAVRIGIVGPLIGAMAMTFLSYLQCIKKYKTTNLFTIIEYFIAPVTCYALFGYTMGIVGLWIAMPATQLLNLIIIYIYNCICKHKVLGFSQAIFPIKDDVSLEGYQYLNFNITDFAKTDKYIKDLDSFLTKFEVKDEYKSYVFDSLRIYKQLFDNGDARNDFNLDVLVTYSPSSLTVRYRDDNLNFSPEMRTEIARKRLERAKTDSSVIVLKGKIKDINDVSFLNAYNVVYTIY